MRLTEKAVESLLPRATPTPTEVEAAWATPTSMHTKSAAVQKIFMVLIGVLTVEMKNCFFSRLVNIAERFKQKSSTKRLKPLPHNKSRQAFLATCKLLKHYLFCYICYILGIVKIKFGKTLDSWRKIQHSAPACAAISGGRILFRVILVASVDLFRAKPYKCALSSSDF